MTFKENLLQKLRIEALALRASASLTPAGGEKLDKEAMRSLLEISPYRFRKERDLDLYVLDAADGPRTLVLDNELPLYATAAEDVALRKSPTVKEMISISNVIKILNDKDVKISKKTDTVAAIRGLCVSALDLSYNKDDLRAIAADGRRALADGHEPGVIETLDLFAELLQWAPPPRAFGLDACAVIGRRREVAPGETSYGPMVIHNAAQSALRLVETPVSSIERDQIDLLNKIAGGRERPAMEGAEVFDYLAGIAPAYRPGETTSGPGH